MVGFRVQCLGFGRVYGLGVPGVCRIVPDFLARVWIGVLSGLFLVSSEI